MAILDNISTIETARFDTLFAPNEAARVNSRMSANVPTGHVLLRQPKSNENDLRVTIPVEFMQGWKPDEWKGVALKHRKVQLHLANETPGLLALKPVASDFLGKGVYRLEQNSDGGQARFMTTRSYVKRKLNGDSAPVPFRLVDGIGFLDLTALSPL
ncbi:hypothetical protein [Mesorhizobium sp. B2-4-17]|uniref:hypothetical protein n=1 Tax=Mesorhizobium sp. B2-4-17 TaxID=2589932 RepID=UPI00112B72C5|nr:hypothetical protein [Mesorhizobium sp. B2-4-17]TPK85224.1 hypothetical protein FJ548_16885 [Mesorhizobium sp. B2-4-17]